MSYSIFSPKTSIAPQRPIPPPPTHGVHRWCAKAARICEINGATPNEALHQILSSAVGIREGRNLSKAEVEQAIATVYSTPRQQRGLQTERQAKSILPWPEHDCARSTHAIDESGIVGVADLWDASPIRCTSDSTDAEFFIDHLFPGDPLLCVGWTKSNFLTSPREWLRGRLSRLELIVPSPMTALHGPRKSDGKLSAHTLANTGPRRFLVTEFDKGDSDSQAALLWHLAQYAPLVMVLWSAGKSLHGWFYCDEVPEEVTRPFMRYAAALGADPATWTRSQFVRIPEGWRADKHRRQEVIFFNPSKLKGGRFER